MAASVRIEDEAFGDPRYDILAKIAGLADADHARGRMARLWRQCTQQRTHVLSLPIVEVIMGAQGVEALITSGLGEEHQRGIRIKGTKGRIEWLDDLRKSAKAGGKARAAKAVRTGGKFTSQMAGDWLVEPTSGSPAQPSAPSPSPSPSPSPEFVLVGASPPAAKKRKSATPRELPPDWKPTAAHIALAFAEGRDCSREAIKFADHAAQNSRLAADWDAAFRSWLRSEYGKARSGNTSTSMQPIRVIERL